MENESKLQSQINELISILECQEERILQLEKRIQSNICLGNICYKCNELSSTIAICTNCSKKICKKCQYCFRTMKCGNIIS